MAGLSGAFRPGAPPAVCVSPFPPVAGFADPSAAALAYYQGDFGAVRRYLEASLPVHRESGDDPYLSHYLQILTMTALAEGDADEARALADEALELARRTRNPSSEAYALSHLGAVLMVEGELDSAQRALEESVRRARELENLRAVGLWTKALGGIALLQNEYPRARGLFEESLAILRSLDDAWGILGSVSSLALVALEEHDNETARRLLDESLELLRKSGHRYRAARILELSANSPAPRIAIAAPLACTQRQASLANRLAPKCSRARSGPTPPHTSRASAPNSASGRSPRRGRKAPR